MSPSFGSELRTGKGCEPRSYNPVRIMTPPSTSMNHVPYCEPRQTYLDYTHTPAHTDTRAHARAHIATLFALRPSLPASPPVPHPRSADPANSLRRSADRPTPRGCISTAASPKVPHPRSAGPANSQQRSADRPTPWLPVHCCGSATPHRFGQLPSAEH